MMLRLNHICSEISAAAMLHIKASVISNAIFKLVGFEIFDLDECQK